MSDQRLSSLQHALYLEDLAKRLAAGDSPRKIARDLNQRPLVVQETLRSDEFLQVLELRDSELADDIRAERESEKPLPYEQRAMDAADRALKRLEELSEGAASEQAQVAASKALIELAEKLKKERPKKDSKRTTFPASQMRNLAAAAREVAALEQLAQQSTNRERLRPASGQRAGAGMDDSPLDCKE